MMKQINRLRYHWHTFQALHLEVIKRDCIDHRLREKLNRKLADHKSKASLLKAV
ncbi:hypothetical protein V1498_20495 [Peribacillus sp. SCS-26]|uniref:hypothetical protein n=1 Tax=Paraperibacillus marinus TaxID=3115295 RepID=UPI0039067A45